MFTLRHFCQESNALEGDFRTEPLLMQVPHLKRLLSLPQITADDLTGYARSFYADMDYLKDEGALKLLQELLYNTNVAHATMLAEGKLEASPAGMAKRLNSRERAAIAGDARGWLAYLTHRAFMELSPFHAPPANGLVGRALWLWCMGGEKALTASFLHTWYMQSLRFGGVAHIEKPNTVTETVQ